MSAPKLLAPIVLGTLAIAGPTIGELAVWIVLPDSPEWSADAALSIAKAMRVGSIAGSCLLAVGLTWALWILEGRTTPRLGDHVRQSSLAYGLAIVVLIQRVLDLPTGGDGGMEITILECFWCGQAWDLSATAVIVANAGVLGLIRARKSAA